MARAKIIVSPVPCMGDGFWSLRIACDMGHLLFSGPMCCTLKQAVEEAESWKKALGDIEPVVSVVEGIS